jgi:hypothetical protein
LAAPAVDKDGVPVVDLHGTIVTRTDARTAAAEQRAGFRIPGGAVISERMIALGDRQMPLKEFLLTYCPGKFQNATCARGNKILSIDNASGPKETLPKGL